MKKIINILTLIWIAGCVLSILLPDPFAFPIAVVSIIILVVTAILQIYEFVIKPRRKS